MQQLFSIGQSWHEFSTLRNQRLNNRIFGIFLPILLSLFLAFVWLMNANILLKIVLAMAVCLLLFISNITKICLLLIITIFVPPGIYATSILSLNFLGFNYIHFSEMLYFLVIFHFVFNIIKSKIRLSVPKEYIFITLFYVIVIWSIFRGSETTLKNSFFSSRELFYYGLAFIVLNEITSFSQIKKLVNAIYAGVSIYILLLLSLYLWQGNPINSLIAFPRAWSPTRISFSNHEIFLLLIPLSLVLSLGNSSKKIKIINVGFLVSCLVLLILSQTRIAIFCAFVSIAVLYLLMKIGWRKLKINTLKLSMAFIGGLVIIILFSAFIFNYAGKNPLINVIKERLTDFSNLRDDDSLAFREKIWNREKEKIKEYLFLGQGMKAFYADLYGRTGKFENVFWDNSNTLMIRKVGLAGYVFLLVFIGAVIKKSIFCYRKSSNKIIVGFSAAFLSIIPGAIIRVFASPFLVQYQIIFVYALIFGMIQAMEKIVKREKRLVKYL